MNNNNSMFYFYLSFLANITQLANFDMQIQQTSTDEIMKDLQRQDKILNEQTEIYLKKIVNQNELIIKQNNELLNLWYNIFKE